MSKLPNCGIVKIKGVQYCWETKRYWRSEEPGNTELVLGIHVYVERVKSNGLAVTFFLKEAWWRNPPTLQFLPECIHLSILQAQRAGWVPFPARPKKVRPRSGPSAKVFKGWLPAPATEEEPGAGQRMATRMVFKSCS